MMNDKIAEIVAAELARVGVRAEGVQLAKMAEKVATVWDELSLFGVRLGALSGALEGMGATGEVLLRVLVEVGYMPTGRRRLEREFLTNDGLDLPAVTLHKVTAIEGWEAARLAAVIAAERKVRVVVADATLRGRVLGELARFGLGAEWVLDLEEAWAASAEVEGCVLLGVNDELWPRVAPDVWLNDSVRAVLGLPHAAWWRQLGAAVLQRALKGDFGTQIWGVTLARWGEEPLRRHTALPAVVEDVTAAWRTVWQQKFPPPAPNNVLGAWVPRGGQYPAVWSASMVQDLMVCPYKAYAERILGLRPLAPLDDVQSARVGGIFVHDWLERAGREWTTLCALDDAAAVGLLVGWSEELLAREDPVIAAMWQPKVKRLAPELMALWRENFTDHARAVVAVEERLVWPVGAISVSAKIDRLEQIGEPQNDEALSQVVVVDFKTGSVPSHADMATGRKPQLPIEGWLIEALGRGEVRAVEHWKLRGFGEDAVEVCAEAAAELIAPVGAALARLAAEMAEGQPFAALPDQAGGGIVARGHCERCGLAGVCRRGLQQGLAI